MGDKTFFDSTVDIITDSVPPVEKTFAQGNKSKPFVIICVALVLGIYGKLFKDYKPFAVFVLIMCLLFAILVVNFVLGKNNS